MPATGRGQASENGTVTGVIKDRDSGIPMKGMITFPGTQLPALVSDSLGRYQAELSPGEYKLHIYANGYRWIERKVTVSSGKTEQWDLTLKRREAAFSGTILDSISRLPVKARIINLGSIPLDVFSGQNGAFQTAVRPGSYQLSITAKGYKSLAKAIVFRDKDQQKVEMLLSRTSSGDGGKWQVRLGGGTIKPMGGIIPEADYGYVVKMEASREVFTNISAGLSLGYGSNKIKGILWDPNYALYQTNYISAELEAKYRFQFWRKIIPYALVDAGIVSWENTYDGSAFVDSATAQEQKSLSPIFRGGAGIEYRVGANVFLWAQGRGGMFLNGDKITTGHSIKDNLLPEASVGAGYSF
jgi:hypothetical protein